MVGDAGRAARGHDLEVLDETGGEGVVLLEVLLAAAPGVGGLEDLARDALAALGHLEAEDRVLPVADLVERPGEGRVQELAGVADADALADPEGAPRPAGVDEPAGGAVLEHLLPEEVGVGVRVVDHERPAEACAERDLRLDPETDLGARDLARVARDEVVDGLLRGEARDRGHDARGVAGQEDDVLRLARALVGHRVRDEVERVGPPGVLGELLVVEVEDAGDGVVDHVLEDRPEAAGGREDLRLGVGREADHLRVAAVLEVEDTVGPPAVLVVADEAARGVGAERRLPGPGEAEEDGRVAVLAHVGRAVHGEDALEGQQVVEDGEDGLLDLAGVARPADDPELLPEVEDDERLRPRAVRHRVRLESRGGDDREVGHVAPRLLDRRVLEEHGAGEEAVPGLLGDDADGEPVLGVGPAVDVLHEDVAALQVAAQPRVQAAEALGVEGPVVLAPPHGLLGRLLADHELVRGGAGGVLPGVHDERPLVADLPLGAVDRLLVEAGGGQVPVDAAQVREAVVLEAVEARHRPRLLHRRRLDVDVDVHAQSLTSLRSPRKSSLGACGSSAHLMRSRPSMMSLIVPQ